MSAPQFAESPDTIEEENLIVVSQLFLILLEIFVGQLNFGLVV